MSSAGDQDRAQHPSDSVQLWFAPNLSIRTTSPLRCHPTPLGSAQYTPAHTHRASPHPGLNSYWCTHLNLGKVPTAVNMNDDLHSSKQVTHCGSSERFTKYQSGPMWGQELLGRWRGCTSSYSTRCVFGRDAVVPWLPPCARLFSPRASPPFTCHPGGA